MVEGLSPSDIRARKFSASRRGFDRGEVTDFLAGVADRVGALESELSSISTRLSQLGITNLVDLKEEIEDVGLEIQNILDAAMAAAEGVRVRASAAAEDELSAADKAATSLRRDAWMAGTAALEDASLDSDRMVAEAREDALFIRAEAEQEAKHLVTQARREAEELVRSSRDESERIVVMAKAESDSILGEAHAAAEKAQERARALEHRRTELLSELQEAESAIRHVESARDEPETDVEAGVRVIATSGHDRTHWPEDEGAVRILPASPPEPDEPQPVDAEAMAAEVELMRNAVTMPEPAVAVESEITESAKSEPGDEPRPQGPEVIPADVEEPAADEAELAETVAAPAEPAADETEPAQDEAADAAEEQDAGESAPTVIDKVTVVKDDPGIDDLFAKLRHSVDESPLTEVTPPEPTPEPEPQTGEESAPPPILRVVPEIDAPEDFERRDRMLLPIENRGLRGLKRRIVELQNRVLEELRRSSGEWRLGKEYVAATMGEELDEVLTESFQAGHAAAAEVMGKVEPQLIGGPEQGAAEAFTTDLHHDIQTVVERGEPGSRRLSADVGRVFRNWRTDEAERHVRDASRRAFNDGLIAGYKRLGVEEVEVVAPGRPCGQCSAGTGLSWRPGESLPSGVKMPPAGPRCAALIVPIAPSGSNSEPGQ